MPSASVVDVIDQEPAVAFTEPICVVPSYSRTIEFVSAVPVIFGVLIFVVISEELVITGADGAVVSTVTEIVLDGGDVVLYVVFVALAVMEWVPAASVGVVIDQEPEVAIFGVPSDVIPSKSWTEVPLPAVPEIITLVLFV